MTPRQIKLLHAIIDEFITSANAVGSVSLADRYHLGVSPATIRNEMADLVELGYLDKPHSSSGRVPTNLAFRFFIDEILGDMDELETRLTANIYEELFQVRFDLDVLIQQSLQHLSEHAQNMAFVLLGNRIYYAGLYYLVSNLEPDDKVNLPEILAILENKPLLEKIFRTAKSNRPVKVLIGEDIGVPGLEDSAIVFSKITLHGDKYGHQAVFGPNRMNYSKVIPLVNFFSDSLNHVISGW